MAHRSIEEEEVLVRSNADTTDTVEAGDDDQDGAKDEVEDDGDPYLPQCKIKRNYSCNLCNFFSQNPRSFLYHSRDVHFDRIKIYECSQCLYASKHSQKLQRHINMIHVAGKTRKNKRAEKKKEVKPPRTLQPMPEPLPELPDLPPLMEMDDDGEVVGGEGDLVDKELRCSVCNFTSSSRMLMRRHERVVHLKKRFLRCSKCSYVTHVKARYTKHVKYHSMPMIKCDLCDFRTPYKWNLDRHYKNHCGTGAFECSKCNFRADIKQSLTVHEMNHHVPPVGQGAIMARKKNKVGASETTALESDCIDKEELELLRLEREDAVSINGQAQVVDGKRKMSPAGTASEPKKIMTSAKSEPPARSSYTTKRESNKELQSDFIHPDDIVPRYGQIYVKNLKCKFCSYKAVFNHEIWRHEKRIHGYSSFRLPEHKKAKLPTRRPPPKLIPIQNKMAATSASPILKIPNLKPKLPTPEKRMHDAGVDVNGTEFNEMCKKSCLTSSLKDIVSLIGDEDALKSIPDPVCDIETLYKEALQESAQDLNEFKKHQTDLLKKKNASFFDKLKEKLLTGSTEECNLTCELCGHESKCLSESARHQKRHMEGIESGGSGEENEDCEDDEEEDIALSRVELSSTRCKHCRQRCKTSGDLVNHLKTCRALAGNEDKLDDGEESEKTENRVFIWNKFGQSPEDGGDGEKVGEEEEEEEEEEEDEEDAVTTKQLGASGSQGNQLGHETRHGLTMKKVFKCPHCTFWASTASRFHVHIVGHLNKKPFECSLCMYRSNWRWDITKHIRLKSARDPRHLEAQVNMTDETGRRNYSKYNKYLTLMKVQEPNAESSGTGRRSRACDATQGTVTDDMIHPLPAPPRLTRAPTPGAALQIPQGAPIRPPPLVKAAQQSPAPSMDATKKTLWKCKKCNFRDSNKEQVLRHVKNHYGKKKGARAQKGKPCGQCQKDKCPGHAIAVEPTGSDGEQDGVDSSQNSSSVACLEDTQDLISCDVCPFTTETEDDLTAHKLNHVDRPGSIFKCTYCPFYVPSKIAVLEHMEVHGVDNANDLAALPVDNFDPSEWNDDFSSKNEASGCKRYRCRQCPYVSNSKTQFLYHKQFHRPRNAPFKCMYCSYNVTRRHLLHQHLRVHHMNNDTPLQDQPEMNTIDMPEIPLVWVQRAGGDIVKMFKCRWCPHVNLRKINIQEHEKMHQDDKKETSDSGLLRLHCPDCSYTCNNPGVLSSHVKVHQGLFGEIRSLVDPTRPDSEQIKFLQTGSRIVEPEVVIKVEQDDLDAVQEQRSVQEAQERAEKGERARLEEEAQPERSYNRSNESNHDSDDDNRNKLLNFCNKCPARFFFKKELRIHAKFHLIRLPFRCPFCTYTARQRPHLLAHYKVHSQDYQEKTAGLVDSYMVSGDCPQPKTAMIMKESEEMDGPVWMVVSQENLVGKVKDGKKEGGYKPLAKHACHRCPAKFFKTVALQYHLTLHGGCHQHKCKYCDYTVKTYGNLIKHQLVHEEGRLEGKPPSKASKQPLKTDSQEPKKPKEPHEGGKKTDPQFGTQMHGRPDFIYPTYLKNGKVKEKRYKCHKCPSAFEKRDQYKVHLSLHGSKQKYKCETCDYSVKYYANYVQHMRKHQLQDEAQLARKSSEFFGSLEIKQEPMSPSQSDHLIGGDLDLEKKASVFELTLIEQQTLLLQTKRKPCVDPEDKKLFFCCYCPYSSNRRDSVDSHARRHACVSGTKAAFECPHCDYSASQGNFLREHIKVHFNGMRHKADGYLKCEKLELWCQEDKPKDAKTLVFRDLGEGEPEDRFVPAMADDPDDEEEPEWKMYVNVETGEPEGEELEDLPGYNDLMDMVDEEQDDQDQADEADDERSRLKRPRCKKWKCKKCPHAFSKKDQYLRHIRLHGSNQLHPCDICDYSVKFYTNYVQHMRMHQMYEPEKMSLVKKLADGDMADESSQDSTDYLQLEPEVIINGEGEDGASWEPGVQLHADSSDAEVVSVCSDDVMSRDGGETPKRVEGPPESVDTSPT